MQVKGKTDYCKRRICNSQGISPKSLRLRVGKGDDLFTVWATDYEGPIVACEKVAHDFLQRIKYQSIDRSIEFVLVTDKENQTRR